MQIAESVKGRRRIIVHVGSAHGEAELGLLVERARELLDDPGQGEFDLGLEPLAQDEVIGQPAVPALFGKPGSAVALPGRSSIGRAPHVMAASAGIGG